MSELADLLEAWNERLLSLCTLPESTTTNQRLRPPNDSIVMVVNEARLLGMDLDWAAQQLRAMERKWWIVCTCGERHRIDPAAPPAHREDEQ